MRQAGVTAELEDDWHRMVVVLLHSGGVVTEVASEMKRRPWTTCPGAMAQLKATFEGHPLASFAKRGEKTRNCTHLHDLAVFAAAQADEPAATAYEVLVSDSVDGRRHSRLWRDGALVLDWTMQEGGFTAPQDLAGLTMGELGDWIAILDQPDAQAARILRWASLMALGRAMDIPAGLSATAFPSGACYTFQPEMARVGTRVVDASVDFSRVDMEPMADRSASFRRS